MQRYTSEELLRRIENGTYQQMPMAELEQMLNDGGMDITMYTHVERLKHAVQVGREHLAEQHRRNLGAETDRRFANLETKVDSLKSPHWSVKPTFYFVVAGFLVAVAGLIFTILSWISSKAAR
jgi:hypothetical protein